MQVQPYLFFDGRCEEAIEFYKSALGAKVHALMRFKEAPKGTGEGNPHSRPEIAEKVMHADILIGEAHVLMSDGMCTGKQPAMSGFSLSIVVPDDATADRVFAAISDGGQVIQPLMSTFFASKFGMAHDKFGMSWMVVGPTP